MTSQNQIKSTDFAAISDQFQQEEKGYSYFR